MKKALENMDWIANISFDERHIRKINTSRT